MRIDSPIDYECVAELVLSHLPDGIAQRRHILETLIAILPAELRLVGDLRLMLGHLDAHIAAQKLLDFGGRKAGS